MAVTEDNKTMADIKKKNKNQTLSGPPFLQGGQVQKLGVIAAFPFFLFLAETLALSFLVASWLGRSLFLSS